MVYWATIKVLFHGYPPFVSLIIDSQAWIEASTKGAVLLFTASELEYYALRAQFSPFVSGIIGGMGGGIAQAYATVPSPLPTTAICNLCVYRWEFVRL